MKISMGKHTHNNRYFYFFEVRKWPLCIPRLDYGGSQIFVIHSTRELVHHTFKIVPLP